MIAKSNPTNVDKAVTLIHIAAKQATENHEPFPSVHHGKAVIQEELDELWEEIKKFPHEDTMKMTEEAAHVGAMAVRFIADICLGTYEEDEDD